MLALLLIVIITPHSLVINIGQLEKHLNNSNQITGKFSFAPLASDIALVDLEFTVDKVAFTAYSKADLELSAVFLCIDKSGSMGTLLGSHKRIDVVKDQLLRVGKDFFAQNRNHNLELFVTFFDD